MQPRTPADYRLLEQKQKAVRDERKANGLCTVCGKPAAQDRKQCEFHLKKARIYSSKGQRKRRITAKKFGWCTTCFSRMAMEGCSSCGVCSERHGDISIAYKKAREANGLCPDCGEKPDVEGRARCTACIKKAYEHAKKRVDKGLCVHCSKPRQRQDITRCNACNRVAKLRVKQRSIEWSLRGDCSKCGKSPHADGRKLCQGCIDKGKAQRQAASRPVLSKTA